MELQHLLASRKEQLWVTASPLQPLRYHITQKSKKGSSPPISFSPSNQNGSDFKQIDECLTGVTGIAERFAFGESTSELPRPRHPVLCHHPHCVTADEHVCLVTVDTEESATQSTDLTNAQVIFMPFDFLQKEISALLRKYLVATGPE